MYTVESVMSYVWTNETQVIIMGMICYGLGFLAYLTNLWAQFKHHHSMWPFEVHCFFVGSDFTFGIVCFHQWLEIGWWFWIALAVGNMLFMCIEFLSLKKAVEDERQEIFGKYCNGAEVTKSYAWKRGLCMYAVGMIVCVFFRYAVGDPMLLALFLVTNVVGGVVGTLVFDSSERYTPGMKLFSIANLLNLVYAFLPSGIGYYATLVPVLNGPLVIFTGVVFALICIYGIYCAFVKVPKREAAARLKEAEGAQPNEA